jgi:branched-chain amino acid transport system substrate-binding protein
MPTRGRIGSRTGSRPGSRAPARVLAALLACVAALTALPGGCGRPPAEGSVGVLMPLSGPLRDWGSEMMNGIQLAWDQDRSPQQPKLLVNDTGGSARGATTAFEELLDQGARVVVGPLTTDEVMAASLVARQREVPTVAPAATGIGVLGPKAGYTVRLCYGDDEAAAALAAFAEQELRLQRLALVVDLTSAYALGLADAFSCAFQERRGRIVETVYYHGSTEDGLHALDTVAGMDVQGALLAGYAPDLVPMVKSAKSPRLSGLVLLGGDGWAAPELQRALAGRVAGAYHTRHFNPSAGTPEVTAFLDAWSVRHQKPPGDFAALGYDAARAVLSVFDHSLDGPALKQRLGGLSGFLGVTGTITLDAQGGAQRLPIVIESFHEPDGPRIVATRG